VRVLVVDDESDSRVLVRQILEDCGASVRAAASADDALSSMENEKPEVVVSDLAMPGTDGYQLVGPHGATGGEQSSQVADIDHLILGTEPVAETLEFGQPHVDRHLAALESGWHVLASLGSFGTATRRFAF